LEVGGQKAFHFLFNLRRRRSTNEMRTPNTPTLIIEGHSMMQLSRPWHILITLPVLLFACGDPTEPPQDTPVVITTDMPSPQPVNETQLVDQLADGSNGPELVILKPGRFIMGSPPSEVGRYPNEVLHELTLDQPFAIGRYEITFDDYARFVDNQGGELPDDQEWGREQRPVINISWQDALAYTDWLSAQTGQRYRLPTEAEWEYAARAGTQTAYWWGEAFDPTQLNCYGCDPAMELSAPLPVGQFLPNPFGLYDVLGNVWEWTCSNYSEDYDGTENQCSPRAEDTTKTIRGGSYQNRPSVSPRFGPQDQTLRPLRSAVRDKFHPDDRNDIIGFRVVREIP
jgi:formylglycine-generating enzyme required for sulfatase activity